MTFFFDHDFEVIGVYILHSLKVDLFWFFSVVQMFKLLVMSSALRKDRKQSE